MSISVSNTSGKGNAGQRRSKSRNKAVTPFLAATKQRKTGEYLIYYAYCTDISKKVSDSFVLYAFFILPILITENNYEKAVTDYTFILHTTV